MPKKTIKAWAIVNDKKNLVETFGSHVYCLPIFEDAICAQGYEMMLKEGRKQKRKIVPVTITIN